MPHLSPMNWIIIPLMMIFTLMLNIVILWWQYNSKFPIIMNFTSPIKKKNWSWW